MSRVPSLSFSLSLPFLSLSFSLSSSLLFSLSFSLVPSMKSRNPLLEFQIEDERNVNRARARSRRQYGESSYALPILLLDQLGHDLERYAFVNDGPLCIGKTRRPVLLHSICISHGDLSLSQGVPCKPAYGRIRR